MAQPCYKANAPGSLILMGEYAVLQGHPCLVLAINQTLSVSITPNTSTIIQIDSALGNHATDINQIEIKAPLEYVLTTLKKFTLPSGADIQIVSELSPTKGLGSSAAVTVALLQALHAWIDKPISKQDLFKEALAIIHQVQGKGSGADIAASIYGGAISFNPTPFKVIPLTPRPEITVVYSGHKTTTTNALKSLSDKMNTQTDFMSKLFIKLGALSQQAIDAYQQQQWQQLGELMALAQQALDTLGVSTDNINSIIHTLQDYSTIHGAKISGSGLGDCVIALGTIENNPFHEALLPLAINNQGVTYVN